jgi:transcriptional regulator with XRE-family HTH domain
MSCSFIHPPLLTTTSLAVAYTAKRAGARADEFAVALGFDSAEELADYLGLEGGEDELAQVIQDSDNPNRLAQALNFNTLDELKELAESEGYDEDEFAQLMQDYSDNPEGLAEPLGFASPNELARYLGLEGGRRDLAQLLRDSNDEDSDKLGELAELNELAESLGYDNLRELAEALGLENRAQLVRVFQDADTPNELADALGYGSAQELAEELGVDRSELRTLLDSAKSDDGDEGSANNSDDDGSGSGSSSDDGGSGSSSNDEESAGTGVSQESSQEAESGDVDQSFTVTNSGDNSNQSAGVQGAVNTASAQSQTTVVQSGSEAGDVEVEGGSSIEVSPEQGTQTQQEVEQAAAAADTELDSPSEQETEQAPTGAE